MDSTIVSQSARWFRRQLACWKCLRLNGVNLCTSIVVIESVVRQGVNIQDPICVPSSPRALPSQQQSGPCRSRGGVPCKLMQSTSRFCVCGRDQILTLEKIRKGRSSGAYRTGRVSLHIIYLHNASASGAFGPPSQPLTRPINLASYTSVCIRKAPLHQGAPVESFHRFPSTSPSPSSAGGGH